MSLAKYYAMCDWFDETCGQLIDHLETAGVTDNTMICLCHGQWLDSANA